MIITCRCGVPLELEDDMIGEEIQCPRCRMTMVVPEQLAAEQPSQRTEFMAAPQPSQPWPAPQSSQPWTPPQPGPAFAPQAGPPPTCSKATACLNLGISSFTVPFVLVIPCFLFGVLALRECRKYRMQGKAIALMGMILATCSTLCLGTVVYMAYPMIKQAIDLGKGLRKEIGGGKELGKLGKDAGGMDIFGQLTDPKVKADSIAKAAQSYQKEKGAFPSPNLAKRNGQPGELSWRVGIVPYLNDPSFPAELQQRIALDQAWNHPANSFLDQQMPLAYMGALDADRPAPPGTTAFQLFTGPQTLFPDRNRGVRSADVAGRQSTTFLLAESSYPVQWQRPADMDLKPGQPLPLPRKFAAAFVDGSARYIDRGKINDQTLRQLIDPKSGPQSLPADW